MFSNRLVHGLALAILVTFAAACGTAPSSPALVPTTVPASATSVDSIAAAPSATASVPTTAPATATVPAATSPVATTSNDSTIRLDIVPSKSQAQYRVREQLANVSLPSDAIGKTQQISGTIVGKTDGTIVSSESKFVVNLASLQSDRSQRDGFLRGNVLQTNQYPEATFVPTQQTGATFPLPTSGQTTFKLTGDLTIRNVTKSVTWQVDCQGQGTEGLCHATTSFTFEYFGLTPPRVPIVLSVVDNITLELDAYLQRAGN